MLFPKLYIAWILWGFLHFRCLALEPITLTVAAVGMMGGLGVWNRDFIADNTYCKFTECCRKPYIKADINQLKSLLANHLYGQHIVQDVLVSAVGGHLDNLHLSRKPLVMSFHGTPGTGKNYVADFVATALYQNAIGSKFVNKFTAPDVKKALASEVKQTVQSCPQSLFIFDEIEKMQKGVFEEIVSLLDHHSSMKGYDFSKAIFIFLSNSGGDEIATKLKNLTDSGRYRDQTTLSDFERSAQIAAYNMDGGLHRSTIIYSHVIDHFIPFLPLEPRHVTQCIRKEYKLFCANPPTDTDITNIKKIAMFMDDTGMFADGGCKRLSKKVESYCYEKQNLKPLT